MIPYQLISMAAILRDYTEPEYKSAEHEMLTDIADSLYAEVVTPDGFKAEYKELYDKYGAEFFDKVLDDMYALDSQLTSDDKVEELVADYEDRISGITASRKVKASGNPFYDKLSAKDKRFAKATQKRIDNLITIPGEYDTSLTIDMWYGDKFEPKKYGADASVYGNGEYRGNIYDASGKIIGDYTCDNSVLIEKNFLIDFGD